MTRNVNDMLRAVALKLSNALQDVHGLIAMTEHSAQWTESLGKNQHPEAGPRRGGGAWPGVQ